MLALFWHTGGPLPSWKLTYPTWVKGKSSTQKCRQVWGYVCSQEGKHQHFIVVHFEPLDS